MTPIDALKTYFGYDSFRPLQEDIVMSVLNGHDTLALLPTGGGKSVCFQIPTLVSEGLCVVITPLIALMKDQVENLSKRNIHAAAIYTGMSYEKQQTALDNCQYGPYRFLYVSPERLMSEDFRNRLNTLPITMIAVDEAHCISQWGYDFRPAYLHIADIRKDGIPILALTATATPKVVDDIQNRLGFKEKNVIRQSFARDNLSYVVRYCSDRQEKEQQLQHILSRVHGSSIVYVRNRKRAEDLSQLLQCSFYHAGLSPEERTRRQKSWKESQTTMVCTNAFGMGIDKSDVRLVIHYDLPDTPEAYFQEAGRAGRDGINAYAVLLYAPEDKSIALRRIATNYPDKEFVSQVYHNTCDYFCIGLGSGLGHSFALHIDDLCQVMHLPILQTYSALHLLSQAGYIHFEDEQETQPRVKIMVSRQELTNFSISEQQNNLLQQLMRLYPGIFTELQYLHLEMTDSLHEILSSLASRHIITYIPRTRACLFTMTQVRQADIHLSQEIYESRAERYAYRLHAMIEYAENRQFCRQQLLLSYFGEDNAPVCKHCDICRTHTTKN
ncbi:MAG: RecQ family ATP-dependent DNA helicase [Paludibacteraceae bacterium]|nr:RecQ family ATP-dependent DNA helicase [Paludibacteraceae bacterium]